MRELTMEESALVSGGDGICVNVDGNRIALGLGLFGTGLTMLSAAEIATGTVVILGTGGFALVVGGTAIALGAVGGATIGSGIEVTSCKDDKSGGS